MGGGRAQSVRRRDATQPAFNSYITITQGQRSRHDPHPERLYGGPMALVKQFQVTFDGTGPG